MRELILFALMLVAVFAVIGMMIGYAKLLEWQEARRATVKRSRIAPPAVMSHQDDDAPENTAPSLQTRPQTEPDRPMMPVPTRTQMLDIFRALRKHGMARDDARALLKIAGLPLDNNLWSQAAPLPPSEPQAVTPIAGRPTSAQFHDDPELEYQPLR